MFYHQLSFVAKSTKTQKSLVILKRLLVVYQKFQLRETKNFQTNSFQLFYQLSVLSRRFFL